MSRIIAFCGPPLSGKSTLAALHGQNAGAPVLEMDTIRQRLMPDSQQSEHDRNLAYACMHYTAEQLARAGIKEIIVVATYTRPALRAALVDAARRCEAQLSILQFRVSPDVAAARFAGRPTGHAAIDLTVESVRAQAAGYPYYDAAPIFDTTDAGITETLSEISTAIKPSQSLDRWIDQIS